MSVPAAKPFNLENFVRSLQCPVSLDFLTTAMHLHPCAHKVNAAALEQLRRGRPLGFPCPVCQREVQQYYPDLVVRELANQVLALSPSDIPALSAVVATEDVPFKRVPYPGNGARFVLESGAWEPYYTMKNSPARRMIFKTITPDSLIKAIGFYGSSEKGDLALTLTLEIERAEMFAGFLKRVGVASEGIKFTFNIGFVFSKPDELKEIMRILVENNQFEEGDLRRLRELVEAGDWRTVTPLTEEEKRILTGPRPESAWD